MAWCRRADFPFRSGIQEGIGTGKPTYLVLVPPQPVLGLLRIGETHEPGWACQAAPLLVCGEVTTCVPGESEHRCVAWHLWDGAEVWCVTLTEKATSLGEKQECNTEWWTLISHCLTLYLESNYIGEGARKMHLTAPFWKGFFLPAYINMSWEMHFLKRILAPESHYKSPFFKKKKAIKWRQSNRPTCLDAEGSQHFWACQYLQPQFPAGDAKKKKKMWDFFFPVWSRAIQFYRLL